jgi:hypothetical protein
MPGIQAAYRLDLNLALYQAGRTHKRQLDRKNLTPKRNQKQNGLFKGFPGTWTQWTWKPSPRSIGYDADEKGQSQQVQRRIPITPVLLEWHGTKQNHGARPASPCCWLPVSLCYLHSAEHGVGHGGDLYFSFAARGLAHLKAWLETDHHGSEGGCNGEYRVG